jgi:uncharacterized Zn finger protein
MGRYGRNSYSRYDRYSFFPQSKSKDERIADAEKKRKALEKKGARLSPVVLDGFKIATTFWGQAWCKNIESYHDYENRLPRGRSYVRSNSVIDLQIESGQVRAQVMGSELSRVGITVKPVEKRRWKAIRAECAGRIGSLVELLRGRLSHEVMALITRRGEGLFPEPAEITFTCSCPDVAGMCKHVAAAMYGIGSRLDTQPELLFLMRGVDSADLIASAAEAPVAAAAAQAEGETLAADELADVFGVELEQEPATPVPAAPTQKPRGRPKKGAVVQPAEPEKKKPRGRPRKTVAQPPVMPPPKTRGRPTKKPSSQARPLSKKG